MTGKGRSIVTIAVFLTLGLCFLCLIILTPEKSLTQKEMIAWQAQKLSSEKVIEIAKENGIIKSIDRDGAEINVWVRSSFYSLDYKVKETLAVNIADCYKDRPDSHVFIRIYDSISGKQVGSADDWSGFSLK